MVDQEAQNVTTEDLDAAIDSILTEGTEEGSPEASDVVQPEAPANDLKAQLSQLGLNVEIPSDLSPSIQELLSKTIAKADERVRGFQSGIDRTASEFGAKAKVYDQLMDMPEFHEWLQFKRGGADYAPVETIPKLDLSTLPADPMERLGVLVEHFAENVVRRHVDPLAKQVGTVGAVVGKIGWDGFVAAHPDAPVFKADIDRFISRGFNAEEAYRYAKGASVDEKGIEDRLLSRFRERMKEVRTASGAGLPKNTPGGRPSAVDYTAVAEKNGMAAAILQSIEEIDKELGGVF